MASQQVLRDHIGNCCTIFCGKDFGELGKILIKADIDSCFRHNVFFIYDLFLLCTRKEIVSSDTGFRVTN